MDNTWSIRMTEVYTGQSEWIGQVFQGPVELHRTLPGVHATKRKEAAKWLLEYLSGYKILRVANASI